MENDTERALLKSLLDNHGEDMATASKAAGKNPTYLFQYFSKGSPRKLPEAVRESLEDHFGKDRGYLKGNSTKQPPADIQYTQEAPVYGYASGAGNKMMLNDGAIIDRQPKNNPSMGSDGFYMIVVGDSMEPRYEQGEKIAVSKSLPPKKGKDCVIEFIDGTAAIKRYKSMSAKELICEQLNPKKEVKYHTNEIIAVYAVVGHEF